mgnify:CR=1 FL=1
MTFDYNSTRKKLILSEYGRNVQNMVGFICDLPTKEERNQYAQVVIDLMGFLNPHLRDVADFKHKLWDHLHIISDFKIDVDSPYPKPLPEAIHFKPKPLNYPQQRIRYKHYGKTVEIMISRAKEMADPERKQQLVEAIANFMKMAYVTWNKDSVADETIIKDLKILSNNELKFLSFSETIASFILIGQSIFKFLSLKMIPFSDLLPYIRWHELLGSCSNTS